MSASCSQCLYTDDHPFGLTMIGGVCSGCYTHREKDELDWELRFELLRGRLKSVLKGKRSSVYDCVVPVIGDAEDYYVVENVLKLGLAPLIVGVNDYFYNDIGWTNYHQLITAFDVDSLQYNPNIFTYKEMVRVAMRKYNHVLWPSIALRTSFPVHVAYERQIPLVVWGQNQTVEQAGKFSHVDEVEMSRWNRIEHDLFGSDLDDVLGNGASVRERDLNYYRYPDIEKLQRRGVAGVYLSHYMRWDPMAQNQRMVEYGFKPQLQATTFDPYERAGSSVYYQIHDALKYIRTGYRKVTDHLCREIRHGTVTREEAVVLRDYYEAQPVDFTKFFNWLGVSASGEKWLMKNRLHKLPDWQGAGEVKLPKKLADRFCHGTRPDDEFVLYAKGI